MHVNVLRWPEEAGLRRALADRGQPALLLVARFASPPTDTGALEDWAWADADHREIDARIASLVLRADRGSRPAPVVDENDVLHVGERWVALGPTEARLARVLAGRPGDVVSRHELEVAAWGGAPQRPNTTDRIVHRLRRHLEVVGLGLLTVRGHGYVLDALANVS